VTSHKEYLHEKLAGMRPRRIRRDRPPFRDRPEVWFCLGALGVCGVTAILITVSAFIGGGW